MLYGILKKSAKFYSKSGIYYFLIFSFLVFPITSCKDNTNSTGPDSDYSYKIPDQKDDGWETASLADVGMDKIFFENLINRLSDTENHRIHSLLIIKDGKLVFEEYFSGEKFELAVYTGETGFGINDRHTLCSATKSFTSALLGIAIDKGYLNSAGQKVFEFFPDYEILFNSTPGKKDLTLHHLLTMTSGLEYDDTTYPYTHIMNDMNRMYGSNDPAYFLLSKNLLRTPGTLFDYRNSNTNILGEIIHKATGQRLDLFSETYLFSKLGISDYKWQKLPAGMVLASGELRLRPRDMAKFGYLFASGGMWNNERILSQEWIDLSTHKHISQLYGAAYGWEDGYGYQWWLCEDINGRDFNAYMASGWGGQWIIVSPEHKLVVVSTAGNYYTSMAVPVETILHDYIIPALPPAN